MKWTRAWVALSLMAVGAVALAMPQFEKDFRSTYGIKPNSKLAKAGCELCHVGKTVKLNLYGAALQKAMKEEKTKLLTGSVLKKVEGLDSDKDGFTNRVEIRADMLPGDPKSHPASKPGKPAPKGGKKK